MGTDDAKRFNYYKLVVDAVGKRSGNRRCQAFLTLAHLVFSVKLKQKEIGGMLHWLRLPSAGYFHPINPLTRRALICSAYSFVVFFIKFIVNRIHFLVSSFYFLTIPNRILRRSGSLVPVLSNFSPNLP